MELNRRQFLKLGGLSLISGNLFSVDLSCNRQITEKPNLLIVIPDQMRGQAIGCLGEEPVFTPNLDRFAQESLVLTSATSNYPICSPARASLMTGKYPQAHKVLNNCNSVSAQYGYELSEDEECWSDILKERGYNLGYIGKYHLDCPHEPYILCANNRGNLKWNEWCPPSRRHGFDFWYAYGTYDNHLRPLYWGTNSARDSFFYIDQWGPEHETDLAVKYIRNEKGKFRNSKKPFGLVVAMNPPHTPYHLVPDQYKKIYENIPIEELTKRPNIPPKGTRWGDFYRKHIKNYYAMITGVDEQFGRIIDALKENGLENNTIVLFYSDHGNCIGIHDVPTKDYHYEESMRVPFLIRWPGRIKPGKDNLLISTPDIYPTLLDLMSFSDNIPEEVQGTSYASVFLTGKGKRPDSQLYMYVYPGEFDMGRRGLRTNEYTLMISKRKNQPDRIELFDNINDPYQLINIAGEQPDNLKKVVFRLRKWLEVLKDPWIKNLND